MPNCLIFLDTDRTIFVAECTVHVQCLWYLQRTKKKVLVSVPVHQHTRVGSLFVYSSSLLCTVCFVALPWKYISFLKCNVLYFLLSAVFLLFNNCISLMNYKRSYYFQVISKPICLFLFFFQILFLPFIESWNSHALLLLLTRSSVFCFPPFLPLDFIGV